MRTNTMSPGEWAADAATARYEREQAAECFRCGNTNTLGHSIDLGVDLCASCDRDFNAWADAHPDAYYDDFLTKAPVLVGAESGRALVGALLFVAALALVILGLIVAWSSPAWSGGHLIGGPLLVVAGSALAWRVLLPGRADR